MRNLHTLFHSACANLCSHHQCGRVLFLHVLCKTCDPLSFYNCYSTDMRWYLIVVLICISMIVSDVQHLFMCLLAVCMFSLDKCLFRSFAFVFLLLSCEFFIYFRYYLVIGYAVQMFSSIHWLPFNFGDGFLCFAETF